MKFHSVDSVDYDDFDNYNDFDNYDDTYDADDDDDDDEYRTTGSIRGLFEGFDRDYYKPIKTGDSFDGKKNSYIEYKSRGDRYENLSPKEYLDMIRSYLRDLINDHKPTVELSNKADNSDTTRGEWKIQLVIQNNCISTKGFEETRSV